MNKGWMSVGVILLYLIALLAVTVIKGRQEKKAEAKTSAVDFFLAGRGVSSVLLPLTMIAAMQSTFAFLGAPGMYYSHGISYIVIVLSQVWVALMVVFFGNKIRKLASVVFFCDELGTMPAFDILPLFSAGRSRKLTLVPIIQSLAQLEKNYGKEGAEIIIDNTQDTIFGGFAPNSQTAEALSKALGSQTILSGSVSKGKESSQTLQMIERPLMTPDELKSIPKGSFVMMKTGTHPMRTRLRLFLEWGITFGELYILPERAAREVAYADKQTLMRKIRESSSPPAPVSEQEAKEQERPETERRAPRQSAYWYGKKEAAP